MRAKIKAITKKYGVELFNLARNIQGTFDIELDINIYYKAQARMERELYALGGINDVYYRNVA